MAVKAFEELLQRKTVQEQTLLLVVGNRGPETPAIESAIKGRALEKNVRLVDSVSDGELRWLYSNCELLLAPSLVEGFGLPVAEGLLCGSRVVCSDIPAFREIGGEACHYFDLHAESGSATMVSVISDALRTPVGPTDNQGRFSLEHVAGEYAVLYSRLQEASLGTVGR